MQSDENSNIILQEYALYLVKLFALKFVNEIPKKKHSSYIWHYKMNRHFLYYINFKIVKLSYL